MKIKPRPLGCVAIASATAVAEEKHRAISFTSVRQLLVKEDMGWLIWVNYRFSKSQPLCLQLNQACKHLRLACWRVGVSAFAFPLVLRLHKTS